MSGELLQQSLIRLLEMGMAGVLVVLCVVFIYYSYRQHAKERDAYREDLMHMQSEHRNERALWHESQKEQAEYVVKEITKISAIIMHVKRND